MKAVVLSFGFIAVLFGFSLTSCKEYTCVDYKTGTFTYENNDFNVVITRTDTHQTEKSDSLNYVDVFKVNWTSDCYYYLTLESTDNPARMPLSKYDPIFVKMSNVDEKGYDFDATILDSHPHGRIVVLDNVQ